MTAALLIAAAALLFVVGNLAFAAGHARGYSAGEARGWMAGQRSAARARWFDAEHPTTGAGPGVES